MRGAVSKSGGNASLATGVSRWRTGCPERSGIRRFEEKYRAVINEDNLEDEQVGQRWGKVEPVVWGRRRYSFTHRTKVFAGGTIRKIH
ncbi:hypothetical protein, partial [Verrucomicrobium sp. 3C]|uniref:hypothetical protein n=1 Tax=Verrucomicrobium sp. 3C TaxID=1134055 RepID=UPI001E3F47DC